MSEDYDDIDIDIEMDADNDLEDDLEADDEDEKEKDDDDDEDDFDVEINKKSDKDKLKWIVLKRENRRSSNMMSLFEFVNIVGTRAEIINSSINETIYVPYENLRNAREIAEAELKQKRCPIIIERPIYMDQNTVIVEHWTANELIIPF